MKKVLIPPRYRLRVKQRLAVVEYAIAHGIKPASRRFALERKTIRRWRDRWRAKGLAGLVPQYPAQRASRLQAEVVKLIEHARRELLYGAAADPSLVATAAQTQRVPRRDSAHVRATRTPETTDAEQATVTAAAAHPLREADARGFCAGRRQGREGRRTQGVPVHRLR
jgi:transposase